MLRSCPNGHEFEAPDGLPAVCPECRVPLAAAGRVRILRVVLFTVLGLTLAAGGAGATWWALRPGPEQSGNGEGGGRASPGNALPGEAQVAASVLQRYLALEDFASARELLGGLSEATLADSRLAGAAERVDRLEADHRRRVRTFEVLIEEIVTTEEREAIALHARVIVGGGVQHVTPPLSRRFMADDDENKARRLANSFPVRTSYDLGFAIEITDAGGRPLTPRSETGFAPLADLHEGQLARSVAQGELRRLLVSYDETPFAAGAPAAADTRAPAAGAPRAESVEDLALLLEAAGEALAAEALDEAQQAVDAAGAFQPDHPALPALRDQIAQTRHRILEEPTTYECILVDLSFDPRPNGDPWYDVGSAPQVWIRALAGDRPVSEEVGPIVLHLLPDRLWSNPGKNRFFLTCPGKDEVMIQVTDKLYLNEPMGSFALPKTMGELPRPEGQIVVEREPEALLLPAEDANRMRRLVLYYRVSK